MSQFKKGDRVELITGGPAMTVSETGNYGPSEGFLGTGPEDGVNCTWFVGPPANQEVREHVFDAAALKYHKSHRKSD